MSISLPQTGENSGKNSGNSGEADPMAKYEGNEETYNDYWQAVGMVRYLGKACRTLGVAKVQDAGSSPWADHYVHFRDLKDGLKDEVNGNDDHEALPGSLPDFRDNVGTPEWDHTEVTAENAKEFGLDPETFKEDEDPIFVMDSYEAPEEVWYAEEGEALSDEEHLKVLTDADGVGKATAENILKHLKETNIRLTVVEN
jgi:hypothetical protein